MARTHLTWSYIRAVLMVISDWAFGAAWIWSIAVQAEFPWCTAIALLMTALTFVYIAVAGKNMQRLLDGLDGGAR